MLVYQKLPKVLRHMNYFRHFIGGKTPRINIVPHFRTRKLDTQIFSKYQVKNQFLVTLQYTAPLSLLLIRKPLMSLFYIIFEESLIGQNLLQTIYLKMTYIRIFTPHSYALYSFRQQKDSYITKNIGFNSEIY